jgi:hypothetical protein
MADGLRGAKCPSECADCADRKWTEPWYQSQRKGGHTPLPACRR